MSLKFDSPRKLRKEKAKWEVDSWEEYDQREDAFVKERLQAKEPTIKGQVRITGGRAKNTLIDIPKVTRPLTDRMKVRIFDILREDIANKTVLDLYSGAGSFALESLSRGAKEAVLVDASKQAENVLKKNVARAGFLPEATVIKSKTEDYLYKNQNEDVEFDIIFMDPPYKLFNRKRVFKMQQVINMASNLLPGVRNLKTKAFKGVIMIKHPRRYPIDLLELDSIKRVETYDFGLNAISIFIVKENIA